MSIENNVQKQVSQNKLDASVKQRETIINILEKQKNEIIKALPNKNIPVDRIIRIISTALSLNPQLLQCTPHSILGCAIQSAQLGLFPDSILGQCYFVPYYNSQQKVYKAQLIIGYRGYIDLFYRSGMVSSVYANVVLADDFFEFEYGSEQKLKHIPKLRDTGIVKFDDINYSYAYINTTMKGFIFNVLDKGELIRTRAFSKVPEEISAWKLHPQAMAMKSAIRRLNKFSPLSTELRIVDMLESQLESESGQNFDEVVDVEIADKIVLKDESSENVDKVRKSKKEGENALRNAEETAKGFEVNSRKGEEGRPEILNETKGFDKEKAGQTEQKGLF